MDYLILLTVLILGIIGGLVGFKWVSVRSVEPEYVNKKLKLYKDNIEELEEEVLHWKGKFNKTKQLPTIQGDFNLSDTSSVESLIREILPQISGLLPKGMQDLARNPKVIEYAMKLYQENPEKAKELFSKFIKKDKQQETSQIAL